LVGHANKRLIELPSVWVILFCIVTINGISQGYNIDIHTDLSGQIIHH
jgi:hypothetical protein